MILFLKNVLFRIYCYFKKFLYILFCFFILYNFKVDEVLNYLRGNIILILDLGFLFVKIIFY